jgi:hypothetical protein
MVGFCVNGNELAYVKCEEFLDQLSNYQISRRTLPYGVSFIVSLVVLC